MAAREYMADALLPQQESDLSTEEQLRQITEYLQVLNEQYHYILCKLNERG